MEADLRALVSRRVVEVAPAGDGVALLFEDGAQLAVRRPFRLCCGREPERLAGRRLVALSAGRAESALEFSGGTRLLVRLAEEQGRGRPALSLMTRRGRLAVWPAGPRGVA